MPSTATDRLQGLSTSTAIKPPCVTVSTAALTLSGEQTVNGVAVVSGDRVLYAPTTASVDSGIWIVSTGAWTRAKDFDGSRDVVKGTIVLVAPGTDEAEFWVVTSDGQNRVGTDAILIEAASAALATLLADLQNTADTAKGDALVGVKLDATGAEGRTQHDKNADTVSVWDFMTAEMKADVRAGTTLVDCSPAFQSALDYCSGKGQSSSTTGRKLRIPGGRYYLGQPLVYTWRADEGIIDSGDHRRLTIEGDGKANTYLIYGGSSASPALTVSGYTQSGFTDGSQLFFRMVGFRLWRDLATPRVGTGLSANKVARIWFEDVDLGWFNNCADLRDCLYILGIGSDFGGGNGGLNAEIATFSQPNLAHWLLCTFSGNHEYAVLAKLAANWTFDSCAFEGNGGEFTDHVVYLSATPAEGAVGATFRNCYFEANYAMADIFIEAGSTGAGTYLIEGNTFQRTDASSYVTNHIRATSTGSEVKLTIRDNGFKVFGAYTPDAGRPVVLVDTDYIDVEDRGNHFESDLERPSYPKHPATGDGYSQLACVARVGNDGATATLEAGWNVASVARQSTGVVRITYRKALRNSVVVGTPVVVGNDGYAYLSAEDTTYCEITTKDNAGTLADRAFALDLRGLLN